MACVMSVMCQVASERSHPEIPSSVVPVFHTLPAGCSRHAAVPVSLVERCHAHVLAIKTFLPSCNPNITSDAKVGIQVGHGIFTTGATIDEAAWWFVSLDKACHVQLLAEAAGEHERWPDEAAAGMRAGLGSPMFGWLSFQTLWDEIIADCPDFLE